MNMQRRPLGRTGFEVAPLAFGGNVFGWTADAKTSHSLLDAFVDHGFNLIDTADVYSRWATGHRGGESESVIGAWLKKSPSRRDDIVLATKVGMDMGDGCKGLSRGWILRAVDASLKRLQTDRIDLYQAHTDDPSTPLQETLETFAGLVRAGKVRAIGASNYRAARLAEALETSERMQLPRYETLQPLYNLCERADFEDELEALARQHEIGVITYFSLARGFLSGKYRSDADLSKSPRGAGVKAAYFNERGFRILAALDAVGAELRATPAQVALAWAMQRPGITAPIASATSVGQFEELAGAARLMLRPSDIEKLESASAPA